jgi:hypothetical protein
MHAPARLLTGAAWITTADQLSGQNAQKHAIPKVNGGGYLTTSLERLLEFVRITWSFRL